ncbi:MAG: hypothetical protein Harvfovirus84_2 [Harvfovirus sp.]|uniref:Uncharacterized protein n=1 Tax=Harvfovirus sp. TaxID=2487768 RepID=A0A3G5A403_9VIRU|nr:MAG: hypothetical protein Harvfovirus84_2 [Harvfovirus sp.]
MRDNNSVRELLIEGFRNRDASLIRIQVEHAIVMNILRSMQDLYLCLDEKSMGGFGKNKYQIFEYLVALNLKRRMVVMEAKNINFYFVRFSHREEGELLGVIEKILYGFLGLAPEKIITVIEVGHSDKSDELVQTLIREYSEKSSKVIKFE